MDCHSLKAKKNLRKSLRPSKRSPTYGKSSDNQQKPLPASSQVYNQPMTGNIEKRLNVIESRNQRVEADKAWETSWTSRREA